MYLTVERYMVRADMLVQTSLRGFSASIDASPGARPWVALDPSGVLTIREGFSWDGASGPCIDTPTVMQASLAHDALYLLIRQRKLPKSARLEADRTLRTLCLQGGVSTFRANYIYFFVRLFGGIWNAL